jgi:hypothetical protein
LEGRGEDEYGICTSRRYEEGGRDGNSRVPLRETSGDRIKQVLNTLPHAMITESDTFIDARH